MKCPSCGFNNMAGTDECEDCHEDLTSLDGVPRTRMQKVLMSDALARLSPQPPLFVAAKTPLLQAVKAMNAAKVGSVLVGDPDHLEGILTERDIVLKAMGAGRNLQETDVGGLMTPSPETLTDEDSVAFAVNKMSVGGYRHIPILKNGRAVGIISIRDVLRYLSKLFP